MNRMKGSNMLQTELLIDRIMKEFEAVGMAVAIIDKSGNTPYEKYFGFSDLESKKRLNEHTIFGLASVTKSFTALSIMQLEEKGLLRVTDPVSRYIPEFTGNGPIPVTIEHFLSHSGGYFPLPRILIGEVAKELSLDETVCGDFAYNCRIAEEGARQVAARLNAQTFENGGLNGTPGQHFSYCNDGYGLLSEIIRRTGPEESYADYVTRHILSPLHMERSFCDFIRPSQDPNAATLYKRTGKVMTGSRDYHDNAFVLNGGGAMKSTLHDLKNYVTMYLNKGKGIDGKQILSEYGIDEMCRPRQPYLENGSYGYGLYSMQFDDLTVYGHGGSLPGVSSHIAWSYEAEAGVIVLCNTSGVPVSLISDALFRAYSGKSPLVSRDLQDKTCWDKTTLLEAAGTYESGEGTTIKILVSEDGTPKIKVDGILREFIMNGPCTGFVRTPFTDTYLKLHRREGRGIYAITYRSRMIPRVSLQ